MSPEKNIGLCTNWGWKRESTKTELTMYQLHGRWVMLLKGVRDWMRIWTSAFALKGSCKGSKNNYQLGGHRHDWEKVNIRTVLQLTEGRVTRKEVTPMPAFCHTGIDHLIIDSPCGNWSGSSLTLIEIGKSQVFCIPPCFSFHHCDNNNWVNHVNKEKSFILLSFRGSTL